MAPAKSHPISAAFWMVGTFCSFSIMAVAGRELSKDLGILDVMLYRSIAGLAIVTAAAFFTGNLASIRTAGFGMHCARSVCHYFGTLCWFFAIASSVPLAQVFAFEFSTPIWAAVLAPIFLGERMGLRRSVAVFFGFLGILIVARPGIIEITPGVFAAIVCAIGFASAAVVTRKLVGLASVLSILFWMSLIQSGFSFLLTLMDGNIALPSQDSVLPLIMVSITGMSAHYCLVNALRLAPATVVMPMDFARLPIIAVVGALMYQERIDVFLVIGAAVIICSNYFNVRMEVQSGGK